SEGGKEKERMFTMLWSCLLPSLSASVTASTRDRERLGVMSLVGACLSAGFDTMMSGK
ncbi:hypothetical protein KUCAC02_029038, partial [Chaenocephalus aceratus]